MIYLKRLLPFARPYWFAIVLTLLFTAGGIFANLVVPLMLSRAVDYGILGKDMGAVVLYCGLLVGFAALRSLFYYLQGVWQGTVGADIVRDLRNALYRKLQRLPFSYYTTMPTGQIMSRMLGDMDAIEQFVAFGFTAMVTEITTFILTLIVLLLLDWKLTLIVLAPMTLMYFPLARFRMKLDPAWDAVREQMGKMTSVLQENVSGVRVVKAFGREGHAVTQFERENALNRQKNIDRGQLEASAYPTMDFISGVAFLILLLAGSISVINGSITLGTFTAFNWYIWSLIWPIRLMGWFISLSRQAVASCKRLFEIQDAKETITDPPSVQKGVTEGQEPALSLSKGGKVNPVTVSPAHPITLSEAGRVEFDNVDFSFPDDPNTPVLKGLTLTVNPGETAVILGGTGSGKSSVINLVPRFYDVAGGAVRVDGADVREYALADLRARLALVPQETFLFSATLRDNIRFGKPDASEDEVVAAAKVAQVHEFAMKLDKGYDTKVGERGVGLSGGQKQRVALARAVLMNPGILILDEATSAVDTQTETVIQAAMAEVMKGRTSIVIAQRLSTVKNAGKIVVLKEGAVVEEGNHEQLYALGGEYRALYDLQFRDQEARDVIAEDVADEPDETTDVGGDQEKVAA